MLVFVLAACAGPTAHRDIGRSAVAMRELDTQTGDPKLESDKAETVRSSGRHEDTEFDEIGSGQALSHESRDTAVSRAREDALSKAMIGAADVFYGFSDYTFEAGGEHRETVAKYLFTSNQGILTELSAGPAECSTSDRVMTCRVRIRGTISFRGSIDPSYLILDQHSGKPLGLDRRQYYHGEPVALSLATTKDSYLYVYSWDADDNLYGIFPNAYRKKNRVSAQELFQIPEEGSGMSYRALLPPGKRSSAERLLIIASEKELLLPTPSSDGAGAIKAGSMLQMAQRLAQMERREWTLQVVPYEIIAR